MAFSCFFSASVALSSFFVVFSISASRSTRPCSQKLSENTLYYIYIYIYIYYKGCRLRRMYSTNLNKKVNVEILRDGVDAAAFGLAVAHGDDLDLLQPFNEGVDAKRLVFDEVAALLAAGLNLDCKVC